MGDLENIFELQREIRAAQVRINNLDSAVLEARTLESVGMMSLEELAEREERLDVAIRHESALRQEMAMNY